jgi:hypothetical protein
MITHATIEVRGGRSELAAFAERLKALFAGEDFAGEMEAQHTADVLHYDIKVEGGVPFPPFALASGEFPGLEIGVEWVNAGAGTRGTARLVAGTLIEQHVDRLTGADASGHAVAISLDKSGYLTLALTLIRTGRDEYSGYALTGRQDALFHVVRDPATGDVELMTTQGAAEWSRAWRVHAGGEPEYREIDPPQPIESAEFGELERLAQDFVAGWIWFGSGPREEIAIELERYQRMGYVVSDANLRSSAVHRIKSQAAGAVDALRYSTLDAESQWVADTIAQCWAREGR